jgi:hypothetical protein
MHMCLKFCMLFLLFIYTCAYFTKLKKNIRNIRIYFLSTQNNTYFQEYIDANRFQKFLKYKP